jgi:hypothetical protein
MMDAGVEATIALPPEPYGDWNEWSVAQGQSAAARISATG